MPKQEYKKTGTGGFFDEFETLEKLNTMGNPLEMISKVIDFEMFRGKLESRLLNRNKKSNAGGQALRYGDDVQNNDFATLIWPWRHPNGVPGSRSSELQKIPGFGKRR